MARYSIKDLEKLSGIKAHTLRMWEKRYGLIIPSRTSTNIRYYNDEDLKRLLNISMLNRKGFKISSIAKMDDQELSEKIITVSQETRDHDSLVENLIIAMVEIDEHKFEKILSRTIMQHGFEETIMKVIYPFFEKIGILWQTGAINPAQEHFVSNLIRQKLLVAIDAIMEPELEHPARFVAFLPENELHELGLLFFTYLIRKKGHKVIYLGQSVPIQDIVEVHKVKPCDYAVTYLMAAMEDDEVRELLRQLSDIFSNRKVFVSGIQVRREIDDLPENVIKVESASEFADKLKYLS